MGVIGDWLSFENNLEENEEIEIDKEILGSLELNRLRILFEKTHNATLKLFKKDLFPYNPTALLKLLHKAIGTCNVGTM